jgi:hypothetical protein
MTNKPKLEEIFFEVFLYQFSGIFLSIIFFVFIVFIINLVITYFDKKTEKRLLKNEIKLFKIGSFISFIFLIIGFFVVSYDAKTFLENNDDFLVAQSNKEWFLENSKIIFADLKPKEYVIYKITSIEEISLKEQKVYLDGKLSRANDKEIVMVDYINSLDKGMLFYVKALIINEEKEIEKVTFFANLKVDDKFLVEKAILYNTNDSKEDIGPNIIFGEINRNE